MPIRLRLALFGMLVAGSALVAFGFLVLALAAGGVSRDQRSELQAQADSVARQIESSSAAVEPSPSPVFAAPLGEGTDPFLVVLDPGGAVLQTSVRLPMGFDVATLAPPGSAELAVAVAAWNRAETFGSVLVGQPRSFVRDQLQGLRLLLSVSTVITLAGAAAGSWVISSRALRPLRSLADTTDQVGRTADLGGRLPAVRPGDELGRLTESFNAMLDRLEEAITSQQRFVADASHELRTPLTSILANAGFLQREGTNEADRREAIADISAEAGRMSRLVENLLRLARSDAGAGLAKEEVDLAVIASKVVRQAARLNPERHIRLSGSASAPMIGNADGLTQLLWILIDNAVKYGGPAGSIEVRVHPASGNGWVLSVADDGPGLPEDVLADPFRRFQRGDPARGGEGSGLGLGIARAIVLDHGGEISIGNRPEGGALCTAAFSVDSDTRV